MGRNVGTLDGKVAFITGAARGQGRAEAVRLAEEGAEIIAVDICGPVETNIANPSTPEDLQETARRVEKVGRRVVTAEVDVRDYEALKAALDRGVAELGRLDFVVANAGMWSYGLSEELTEEQWRVTIDVVLTGVWHTAKAAIPILKAQNSGGSIVLTSSSFGIKGIQHMSHYVAAKHGVGGLMRTLALELAPHNVRVNTVNPTTVNTDLVQNAATYALFSPEVPEAERTIEAVKPKFAMNTALPVPWVEVEDVAEAVHFLLSDASRYITGLELKIDAGQTVK
jgi:SDR family mycofactocin-dependent oxidoreductase